VEAVDEVRRDAGEALLTVTQRVGLEAIVSAARPALVMTDGQYAEAGEPWEGILQRYSGGIATNSASVGRVQARGLAPPAQYAGTGFLVADDVVMTNAHVARNFAAAAGDGSWRFVADSGASVEFSDAPAAPAPGQALPGTQIAELIGIHDRVDLALLRLDGPAGAEPLTVTAAAPVGMTGRRVYVMGYPAPDLSYSITVTHALFGDKYGIKRLQPGGVMEPPANAYVAVEPFAVTTLDTDVFFHDASTLGGNSGSCVVDLESNEVLGLHYAGLPFAYNIAVALWRLADDPLLAKAQVKFD
jgi:S1-C subfamily serine protease